MKWLQRNIAASMLGICLLTAPVLPAFGQNCGNGNGNGNGNGCKTKQHPIRPRTQRHAAYGTRAGRSSRP